MKKRVLIFIVVVLGLIMLGFLTHESKTGYSVTTKISKVIKQKELGLIKINSLYRDSIVFKNIGEQPLIISSVKKSTEELLLDQSASLYKVKQLVSIPFLFQPKKLGKFKEELIIHGNFPEEQLTVTLIGEVME